MALTFISRNLAPANPAPSAPVRVAKNGHSKPLSTATIDLEQPGRLRAGHLMTLFSVSHSTLYNRIRTGLIPQPDGADGTRPFWKTETVRQALQQ